MPNIPTQTLSQLVASASEDLHSFADANLIDEDKLIKVVARCNEVLGVRINRERQIFIPVVNGLATIPLDFYKAEALFGIHSVQRYGSGIIDYGNQVQQTNKEPCNDDDVVGWGQHTCETNCNETCYEGCLREDEGKYWIERKPSFGNQCTIINNFSPIKISNPNEFLVPYSPSMRYGTQTATIDMEEGVINAPFQTGEIFLCYLANFTDPNTGKLLVPFHPMLNDYYEYSIKTKILENVFMNSEADVWNKLQYAKRERNLSYADAIDFVMSAKGRQWVEWNKKREHAFYNKWFKMFL